MTGKSIRRDFLTCYADQLTNKKDDLLTCIADHKPDIIAITGVLPKLCINVAIDSFSNIPDYSLYNNFDDNMSSKPSGILIYTKSSLPTEKGCYY